MKMNALAPTEILSNMMNRLYYNDLNTSRGGNVSVKTDEGVWITPGSLDKSSMKEEDIILISPNGDVRGKHKPTIETPMHTKIMSECKNFRAVIHGHALTLIKYVLCINRPILSCFRRVSSMSQYLLFPLTPQAPTVWLRRLRTHFLPASRTL